MWISYTFLKYLFYSYPGLSITGPYGLWHLWRDIKMGVPATPYNSLVPSTQCPNIQLYGSCTDHWLLHIATLNLLKSMHVYKIRDRARAQNTCFVPRPLSKMMKQRKNMKTTIRNIETKCRRNRPKNTCRTFCTFSPHFSFI